MLIQCVQHVSMLSSLLSLWRDFLLALILFPVKVFPPRENSPSCGHMVRGKYVATSGYHEHIAIFSKIGKRIGYLNRN